MRLGAATKNVFFLFELFLGYSGVWTYIENYARPIPFPFGPTEPNDNYDDYTTQRTQTQQGRARGKDAYSTFTQIARARNNSDTSFKFICLLLSIGLQSYIRFKYIPIL